MLFPFLATSQTNELEGYWYAIENNDTVLIRVVKTHNITKKRDINQADSICYKVFQIKRNSSELLYFYLNINKLTIIDVYGNKRCYTAIYYYDNY